MFSEKHFLILLQSLLLVSLSKLCHNIILSMVLPPKRSVLETHTPHCLLTAFQTSQCLIKSMGICPNLLPMLLPSSHHFLHQFLVLKTIILEMPTDSILCDIDLGYTKTKKHLNNILISMNLFGRNQEFTH